jgi:hypothetical protein
MGKDIFVIFEFIPEETKFYRIPEEHLSEEEIKRFLAAQGEVIDISDSDNALFVMEFFEKHEKYEVEIVRGKPFGVNGLVIWCGFFL